MDIEENNNLRIQLAQSIADRLANVKGVSAIALGGSLARNTGDSNSDIDLGIYYYPDNSLDIAALNHLAFGINDEQKHDLATQIGEWGPWINGGAWLSINIQRMDWVYRDIDKVQQIIQRCLKGETTCHYQPGHPAGFYEHMYLAEIHYAKVLYDPNQILSSFKKELVPYPPSLKSAIIDKYLWEAQFSLETALKPAKRIDVFYVIGCLFRTVACLVQVIYAGNEAYFINEKGALKATGDLAIKPDNFEEKVTFILKSMGDDQNALLSNIRMMQGLVDAVKEKIGRTNES